MQSKFQNKVVLPKKDMWSPIYNLPEYIFSLFSRTIDIIECICYLNCYISLAIYVFSGTGS
jgi:hypothetical protein